MRVLGPIVLSQALLMVTGKPEVAEGSAVGAQLIVTTFFGANPCFRISLRMSLTAARRSRRR